MDLLQPGWCAEVVEQSFLPRMIASNVIAQARLGGLSRRPGPEVPGLPNLYVAGDWVWPRRGNGRRLLCQRQERCQTNDS
ncbi:hypothetical protein KSX_02190 [Ktedonospora formicarum]|uniref:Uncharacterized protein n=2 Tax=Ktedonospora formicarum TaxID=2778364 RepID=A0A8J3MPS3_9CHLR|nr:hypothetical protein KSX_02190 [Ktedonospora formicarum]